MHKVIKTNIKRELKSRDISIESLCKSLGYNRNFIAHIKDNVKLNKIQMIAREIGCTMAELLKDID